MDREDVAMRRQATAAFVTITVGSLLLSACISRQDMLVRHRAACVTYGFTPGTEQYSNCLLQLDVGEYGYGHHGRRPTWLQGRPGQPPHPPIPQEQ